MKKNNIDIEEYLVKIYEQNEKILALLESKAQDNLLNATIDETKKNNIEKMNTLSPRELQIIGLLIDGKFNKQIAHDLDITSSTVEFHRSNIMKKLDAKNIGQMIKMYLQWEGSV